MFLFDLRSTTLLTFVQDRAQKYERDAEKEEKRRDDVRKDSNVGILCGSEEIDREEKNKSEERRGGQHHDIILNSRHGCRYSTISRKN